jgi:tetratricopeptide (TPR) repeat protein
MRLFRKNCFYFASFLFLLTYPALAENPGKIDSLKTVLSQTIPDTVRVNTLYLLGYDLRISDYSKSMELLNQALDLSKKINFKRGLRKSYGGLGIVNGMHGNYKEALFLINKTIEINSELHDTSGLGSNYGNLGVVYFHLGNYNKAIECYMKSLKFHQIMKDEDSQCSSYNNLGNLYTQNNNIQEGLKYHEKALKIRIRLNDRNGMATSYGNIGNCYEKMGKWDEALSYFYKALEFKKESDNEIGMAVNYGNIAYVKYMLKDYDNALPLYTKALDLRKKLNDKQGMSVAYTGVGNILVELKRYDEAIKNLQAGLKISLEIESKDDQREAYQALANCYYRQKKYKESSGYFLTYDSLNTELNKSYNAKQAADMQANLDIEFQQNEILQLKKDADITNLTLEKQSVDIKYQRVGIILSVVALLSIGIILFFVYRNYRDKKKNNALLMEKNSIIEQKNKEVIDSINYAKKIQRAILPSERDFKKIIPESFALLKPKDIVSGDFYWIVEEGDEIFYAAADCTGHGVPGGFMTMLGSSFIHEIIVEKKMKEPAVILDLLRDRIITALKQTGASGENKDGMDIVLCRLNKKTNRIVFASANNSLYHISNGMLKEYKADKQPIGYYHENTKPFTQHELQLNQGDSVYTFSDGYADQFGGHHGKKFKYSQMKEILLKNYGLSMDKQKEVLNAVIEEWKGSFEQIDDILVIGVKV